MTIDYTMDMWAGGFNYLLIPWSGKKGENRGKKVKNKAQLYTFGDSSRKKGVQRGRKNMIDLKKQKKKKKKKKESIGF